uniref:Uncharacterized protein LOC102806013 n=1 Tax=Saccoglossus kowalevskii TaxID=10224 RepID=A0ABM0MKR0_SACKO|nr:PREDICTED: uncharacterized protein LOC102806013 [Saccoglossus kowalevskii]
MADETQDYATCEQISLCIRYVYEDKIREDFLGFVQLEKMGARTIADKIFNTLTGYALNMDNMVGHGYDGAAMMSSDKNGVQDIIQRQYSNATYVHCRSHTLALALAAGCRQVPETCNLFDSVEKLTWFLGGGANESQFL